MPPLPFPPCTLEKGEKRIWCDMQLTVYLSLQVQTVAIFEIIIAAPVGALLIGLLGPRLLKKSGVDLREEERNEMTEEEIEEQQWLEEHPEEVVCVCVCVCTSVYMHTCAAVCTFPSPKINTLTM